MGILKREDVYYIYETGVLDISIFGDCCFDCALELMEEFDFNGEYYVVDHRGEDPENELVFCNECRRLICVAAPMMSEDTSDRDLKA